MDTQLTSWLNNLLDDVERFAQTYDALAARVSRGDLLDVVAKLDTAIASDAVFAPGSNLEYLTPEQVKSAFVVLATMLQTGKAQEWDKTLINLLRRP